MAALLKRQRRLNKILMMLKNEKIEVSETPTNVNNNDGFNFTFLDTFC